MAVQVSPSTTRRRLHETGLYPRVAPNKSFLSAKHIAFRLEFARKHKHATMHFWNTVCWTDESSFEIDKNFRKPLVWRTAYEMYNLDCLAFSFKAGRYTDARKKEDPHRSESADSS